MLQILFDAGYETMKMVFIASILTIGLGMPLGLLLEATNNHHILGHKYLWLHKLLHKLMDFTSNIPVFLILITIIPIINNLLYEYFTIQLSTALALGIVGIFIFAKDLFQLLNTLPKELSDTAKFLGAEPMQILTKFLLPQAIEKIVQSIIKIVIQLISLAIMASMLGVDGLGKLALEKGFQEAELAYLFYVILCTTSIIYFIKFLGSLLISYIENKYHKDPNNPHMSTI